MTDEYYAVEKKLIGHKYCVWVELEDWIDSSLENLRRSLEKGTTTGDLGDRKKYRIVKVTVNKTEVKTGEKKKENNNE